MASFAMASKPWVPGNSHLKPQCYKRVLQENWTVDEIQTTRVDFCDRSMTAHKTYVGYIVGSATP